MHSVCTQHSAQEHIRYELQGVQKADHRGNRSRNGKFWKSWLKMSVKAVLTRSSMRGLTMGRKGLQLTFIIPSRTLSEMSTRAVDNIKVCYSQLSTVAKFSHDGDGRMNDSYDTKLKFCDPTSPSVTV